VWLLPLSDRFTFVMGNVDLHTASINWYSIFVLFNWYSSFQSAIVIKCWNFLPFTVVASINSWKPSYYGERKKISTFNGNRGLKTQMIKYEITIRVKFFVSTANGHFNRRRDISFGNVTTMSDERPTCSVLVVIIEKYHSRTHLSRLF
jgi:hypothetical protein